MKIKMEFDCTEKELIRDIACKIYSIFGCNAFDKPVDYLMNSQHPTERTCWVLAEEIYEMFSGDSPEYLEEDLL